MRAPDWQTEDGAIRLFCGDCLSVLPQMEAESVDVVAADLPYGTTNCDWDRAIPLAPLWMEYLRVAIDRAPFVLMAQTPFDKVLGCSQLDLLRYEWIWHKSQATGHLNASRAPMKAHENVLVFYRSQPTYNAIKTSGHERKTSTKRRCETPVYGKQTGVHVYDSTERLPRSVLEFPSDKQTSSLHPTQKPVALMEYLVLTYSNTGDVVLDNAMGSGTTGVACARTGRRFIGIEKEEKYFQIAVKRIEAELKKLALFEPPPKVLKQKLILE